MIVSECDGGVTEGGVVVVVVRVGELIGCEMGDGSSS